MIYKGFFKCYDESTVEPRYKEVACNKTLL